MGAESMSGDVAAIMIKRLMFGELVFGVILTLAAFVFVAAVFGCIKFINHYRRIKRRVSEKDS